MLRKRPTKAQLRAEMECHTAFFIKKGGEIKQVECGESALEKVKFNRFEQPSSEFGADRTNLSQPLNTLVLRKQAKVHKSKHIRPKQKIIYDDFGEPLRRVWQE